MSEPKVKPTGYFLVFAALMVLTALTVIASRLPFGAWDMVIAMGIAIVKAVLVVLIFMHVLYSSRLTWIIILSGLIWLTVLIVMTMNDYLTRGWFPVQSFG